MTTKRKRYTPMFMMVMNSKDKKPIAITLVKPGETYAFEGHRQYLEKYGAKV